MEGTNVMVSNYWLVYSKLQKNQKYLKKIKISWINSGVRLVVGVCIECPILF